MIAVGQTSKGATNFTGTATTAAVTTGAAGSTFYVGVVQSGATAATINVTDSKGNVYTAIGTPVGDNNNRWLTRYRCVNGVGGSGHTVTAAETSATNGMTVFLIEILGAAASAPLDQSNTNAAGFVAPPMSSGSITLAPGATGELAISLYQSEYSNAAVPFAEANGFTIQQSETNGTSVNGAAIATKIITAAGAVNASWSDGTGGNFMSGVIDSFKGATSSGAALAAAAASAISATASLATAIRMGTLAADGTSAAAGLVNWTSVTLAGTLYTGIGSILDPVVPWDDPPTVGSIVWYDPAVITVLPTGETAWSTDNTTTIVMYNDGSGWQERIMTITPFMVGYATDLTTATAALTGGAGATLSAAASTIISAAVNLLTQVNAATAGMATASASGLLSTGIRLGAAATNATTALTELTTAVLMAARASVSTSGAAALGSSSAALAGSASQAVSATAVLATQIPLVGTATALVNALADLATHILAAASAFDGSTASASFSPVGATLGGAATEFTVGNASLRAQVLLLGAGVTVITATGDLVAGMQYYGQAVATSTAAANLSTSVDMSGDGVDLTFAAATIPSISGSSNFVIRSRFARRFTVSSLMKLRFDAMLPGYADKLVFDFTPDLPAGITLIGPPVVDFSVLVGVDPNPAAIANTNAGVDATATKVIVPVKVQIDGCDYQIVVKAATTDPLITLVLIGVLPVRS